MELIRHARRRNRGHARKHAERTHDATLRHDHDATCKPIIYDCADREWQRERSHTRGQAPSVPSAPAPSLPDAPVPAAAPAPLSAPLAASFPPIGL
ncbi:MAG: hypothetical protein NTV22_08255 [bacterium]|nr:hypothetical protein [bacterium]